jgi:CHASE1-domain containing sensor protein
MLAARALFVLMVALKLWQLLSRVQQRQRRQRLERCWAL